MFGVFRKSLREVAVPSIAYGSALLAVTALISYVLPKFRAELSESWLKVEFIRKIVTALVGTELGAVLDPVGLTAFAWAHPVVLALVWAHSLTISTRLPAAEIDRGTIDVLLGLPVSRGRVFVADCCAIAIAATAVLTCVLAGNLLGTAAAPPEHRPSAAAMAVAAVNGTLLYFAVAALTLFVASLCDRRGKAVAVVLVLVIASFLINFLAPFWEPMEAIEFLSFLYYYRPVLILVGGEWPVPDLIILTALTVLFGVAAYWIFRRRDICTV